MNKQTFQLKISPDKEMISIALQAAREYAGRFISDKRSVEKIILALEEAIANVLNYSLTDSVDSIKIYAEADAGELKFSVIDKGIPGDFNETLKDDERLGLSIMQNSVDIVNIKSLGIKGRCQELIKYCSDIPDLSSLEHQTAQPQQLHPKEIKIIPLRKEDCVMVARGIYSEYGYTYSNDIVYYPDRLFAAAQRGDIYSVVAVDENGVALGHLAAFEWGDAPGIWESGMAVVNSIARGLGIFNKLMDHVDNYIATETDAAVNVGDAVTTHTFSQQAGYRTGSRGTAFTLSFLSSQFNRSTLKKNLIGDDDSVRENFLLTPKMIDFSAKIVYAVPEITDITDYVYGILNLNRTVLTEEIPPEIEKSESISSYKEQFGFAKISIYNVGKDIEDRIALDTISAKRNGAVSVQLKLSMDRPGLAAAYKAAKAQGYFCTGILPGCKYGDILLMQRILSGSVRYEDIKVLDEYKPLLEMIRKLDPDQK